MESSRPEREGLKSTPVPCGKTIKELRSLTEDKKSSATFPKDYVNSTDETLDEISSSESIYRFPRAQGA